MTLEWKIMLELKTAQRDRLLADLRGVIADAEELLNTTAGEVGAKGAEARSRIQAKLQQAKGSLLELQDSALAKAKAAGHEADEFVHDNPWKAIGAAAGVGLLLGLLIGRR